MRPAVPLVTAAAMRRCDDLLNSETDSVRAMDLARFRLIFSVVGKEWDSAVADRLEDISMMTALLRKGLEIAVGAVRQVLSAALESAAPGTDMRISTLDERIDRLSAAACELQQWLESTDTQQASALLKEVWSYLEHCTRRHAVMDSIW